MVIFYNFNGFNGEMFKFVDWVGNLIDDVYLE